MPPGRTGRLSLIHLTSGLGWTETLDRIGRRDFQFHLSVRQQLNGDPLVGDHLLAVLAPLDLRQKTCGRRLAPTFAVNFSGDWEFVAQKLGPVGWSESIQLRPSLLLRRQLPSAVY